MAATTIGVAARRGRPRADRSARVWRATATTCALAALLLAVACAGQGNSAPAASATAAPPAAATSPPPAARIAPPSPTPDPTPAPLDPAPWGAAPTARDATPAPDITATSAVVMDEASGAVLFALDEHRRLAPASLTKIATAVVAVQRGDLDATVDVDVDSRTMRGSSVMGLLPGDAFTLRDLLYGLLLPSGNDAALAIGRAIAGSDVAFVEEMNALTARLGLVDTHFTNPHGLGGRSSHYSSAYDLAVLARLLMATPPLPDIVATRSWTAEGTREIAMSTLNGLLYAYAGTDGVKTGYTRSAGQTLAASATRDGHRIFVVLLSDSHREYDAERLFDWAFAHFAWGPAPPEVARGSSGAPS